MSGNGLYVRFVVGGPTLAEQIDMGIVAGLGPDDRIVRRDGNGTMDPNKITRAT